MEDLFGTIYEFLPLNEKYDFILKFGETKFLKQYTFDNDIVNLLIRRKRGTIIKKIINCDAKIKSCDEILYWSIKTNELKIFAHLISKINDSRVFSKAIQMANNYGHINMIKKLVPICDIDVRYLLEDTVFYGHIEILKYLLKYFGTRAYDTLIVPKYLFKYFGMCIYDALIVHATLNNHKKILKYLLSLSHNTLLETDVGWVVYHAQKHGFCKAAKILSKSIVDFDTCKSEYFI